jgi:dsDNA-specific endonuclease/ATPase MutS2
MLLDFLFDRFRRGRQTKSPGDSTTKIGAEDESEQLDPNNPFPDVVVIEFQDVIDLHSIPPRQVRAVVEDYLEEAHRRGARWVRIIHGKGIGVQRETVRSILSRTPNVVDFRDAPAEAGGWGATVVTLRVDEAESKPE